MVRIALVPRVTAALHLDTVLLGGTVDAQPAAPLTGRQSVLPPAKPPAPGDADALQAALTATPPLPLSLGSLQRWLGTVAPAASTALASLLRGGPGGGAARRDDDDDDEARGADLGLGGGSDAALHPIVAAHLAMMGKRRLRPLPRGAEDAVVGYWRFERGDDEVAAEKARERDLRRAGRWGPKAPPSDVAAGLWGVAQASQR